MMHLPLRRFSLLPLLSLLAGACATNRPALEPAGDAARPGDLEEFGDQFWRAVRDEDDDALVRHLANHLKRPPAQEALVRELAVFVWENGPLKTWQMTAKARAGEDELREYELRCARGVVRAVLTFHNRTRHITDLKMARRAIYVPAPAPGIAGAVSWTDTTVGPGLGATIAVPRAPAGARLPAMVLIGDSGRLDRDETTGLVRPFRDLGDGLAARGVVTIRFDKRSFSMPEVFGRVFTIDDDLVQDGASAVAVVRRQPAVDPSRVFIVGHGLGGLAAVAIARRVGNVAGVVLVGVPARPLLYVTLEELRDSDPGDKVMARAAGEVQSVTDGQAPPDKAILGAPAAFWYDLAKRNTLAELRALGRPVLLLRGETDSYASANDQQRWLNDLSGTPVRAESVPLTDHLMVAPLVRRISSSDLAAGAGPQVSAYLLDMVADFVVKSSARSVGRAN